MPENEFEIEQIGEVYAQALLNLAKQHQVVAEVGDDVHGIGELLKTNPGFAQLVEAVTLSEEEHIAAMTKIFGGRTHQLTLETLKSMARRGRLMFLGGLVEAWDALIKRASGHVDVQITTASALSPQTLDRVKEAVGRATGKTADMGVKTDASLIGGMKVQVGDTLIDASVESQLSKMQARMKKEGLAGIQKRLASVMNA